MEHLAQQCFFCDTDIGSDGGGVHADTLLHRQNVRLFFQSPETADATIQRTRPTHAEREHIECCITSIQRGARCAEVHLTGSIGKGTALRDCHDLDIAIIVDNFLPVDPKSSAMMLAERFRESGIRVKWCEKHLVKVQHQGLEVDVVPTGRIDAGRLRSLPDTDGWRGSMAMQHANVLGQMPAWRKDVVRLLKAWSRLKLPVPGLLLELVAQSVPEPSSDRIREGFKHALFLLSQVQRTWKDPFRPQDTLNFAALRPENWTHLHRYAISTLQLEPDACYTKPQPSLVKNNASMAEYNRTPEWEGAHKSVSRGTYTEGLDRGHECVVKRFKHGSVYSDVDFADDLRAIENAKSIAAHFNEELNQRFTGVKLVYVNEAQVWNKVEADSIGHAKLLVEPLISGKYQRFNSNTGFQASGNDLMAALSPCSFHRSLGRTVLCDLQGGCYNDCYILTDPVILSANRSFGATDLGQHGIDHFFSQHRCTSYCNAGWRKPANARKIFDVREGSSMIIGGQVRYGSRTFGNSFSESLPISSSCGGEGLRQRRSVPDRVEENSELDTQHKPREDPMMVVWFFVAFMLVMFVVASSSSQHSRSW
mmetsp:Transcript_81518/g.234256  ORF Transcript_81518/g.234256 Transcript_81518/m.234256 type:complete len:593 (-) Transcript_81518:127-1905(-)